MPVTVPSRPVAVDLFAGAGGLSLGLEQAGFDVLSSVEYDPVHAAVHERNFPLTDVLCKSAADVTGDQIRASVARGWERHHPGQDWDGRVHLVAGGPPCQGFSWIGKRQVDDARNDLVFHFFRLVAAIRPDHFVMENVPGMASGAHKALLDDLVDHFRTAGYVVQPPRILNAADYGVPQDRRRLILIGSLPDVTPASHPAASYVPARPVRSGAVSGLLVGDLPAGPTVWDAVGDLPDLDRYKALLGSDKVHLTGAARAKQEQAASPYARRLMGADPDPGDFSHPRAWDPTWLTSSMRTEHTDLSVGRFRATTPGTVEPVSRFLRLPPDGLSNTLRAGTGGERGAFTSPRPIHPTLPRVISVREAARLHSFPDWFRFHATKWNGFRQIGNAVAPLMGRAIGTAIIDALGAAPSRPDDVVEPGPESLLWLSMKDAAAHLGADQASIPKSRRVSREQLAARETGNASTTGADERESA